MINDAHISKKNLWFYINFTGARPILSDNNGKSFSRLGRTYRIESDYGIATAYSGFRYEQHRQRLISSNQYWALLKWFNHWFASNGWGGRYELMGWQTFPSGARFLVERFEPNELGAHILQDRERA